jgi:hypothetical protein
MTVSSSTGLIPVVESQLLNLSRGCVRDVFPQHRLHVMRWRIGHAVNELARNQSADRAGIQGRGQHVGRDSTLCLHFPVSLLSLHNTVINKSTWQPNYHK